MDSVVLSGNGSAFTHGCHRTATVISLAGQKRTIRSPKPSLREKRALRSQIVVSQEAGPTNGVVAATPTKLAVRERYHSGLPALALTERRPMRSDGIKLPGRGRLRLSLPLVN